MDDVGRGWRSTGEEDRIRGERGERGERTWSDEGIGGETSLLPLPALPALDGIECASTGISAAVGRPWVGIPAGGCSSVLHDGV
jgi:hypothetical protein